MDAVKQPPVKPNPDVVEKVEPKAPQQNPEEVAKFYTDEAKRLLGQGKYGPAISSPVYTTYSLSNFGTDLDGSDGFVQNGRGYLCIWDSGGGYTLSITGGALGILLGAWGMTPAVAAELRAIYADIAAFTRRYLQQA